MKQFTKFALIGGGSWGTAIACLIARSVGNVTVFTQEVDIVHEISHHHTNNKYLNGVILPTEIHATNIMQDVMSADVIILAIPSHAFVEVLERLKKNGLSPDTVLLIATKGLCDNPVELLSTRIDNSVDNEYAFISGPNFATEVAQNKFTSVTITSRNMNIASNIAAKISTNNLCTTTSNDVTTVQIANIVKNIIAIKSGIMNAKGCGQNAKAWLVSKALEEIAIISNRITENTRSCYEAITLPAVVGDLVLTCYSSSSRNTRFGYEFHNNHYAQEFLENYPTLIEGVQSAKLFKKFIIQHDIPNIPVISSVLDLFSK